MSTLGLQCALTQQGQPLLLRQVRPAIARNFLQGGNGFHGVAALRDRQEFKGSEQAANESWGQLGYPVPDSRPLAADVSAAGHAYRSYTGAPHLSR